MTYMAWGTELFQRDPLFMIIDYWLNCHIE